MIDDGNGGKATGQITVSVKAYETITVTNKSGSGGSMVWWLVGIAFLLVYRRRVAWLNSRASSQLRLTNQGDRS
jgi:hypothetical protein